MSGVTVKDLRAISKISGAVVPQGASKKTIATIVANKMSAVAASTRSSKTVGGAPDAEDPVSGNQPTNDPAQEIVTELTKIYGEIQYPPGAKLKWQGREQEIRPADVADALAKVDETRLQFQTADLSNYIKNAARNNTLFGKANANLTILEENVSLLDFFVACLDAWAKKFTSHESMTGEDKPFLQVFFHSDTSLFLEPILTRHVNVVLKRIYIKHTSVGGGKKKNRKH